MARFRTETEIGNPGVLMGVLLASLSEPETLVTDYALMEQSGLPDKVVKRLTKLRRVTIRNNLDSRIIKPYPGARLSSVFCLPRLENLSTVFQRVDSSLVTQASLQTLRTLKLIDHLSHPSAIRKLLAKTPNLENLSYFLVEDTDDLAEDEYYEAAHKGEWPAFVRALSSVARSLKTLQISIDEAATSDYPPDTMDEEWMMGISSRRGRVGSLLHLQSLTKLEIPMYLLLGRYPHCIRLRDEPPPSLKKLYLRDGHIYDPDLDNCEAAVVIAALESYLIGPGPNETLSLRELRIKLRSRGPNDRFGRECIQKVSRLGEQQHCLGALETMGRQAGVRCTPHLRKETFISTNQECIDEVDELVLYDPSPTRRNDGTEDIVIGATGYPTRRLYKRARCFESNV